MQTSLSNIHCSQLKGVGPSTLKKLEQLGITSVSNLIFHLPIRYENKTKITPLQSIIPGQTALVEGRIVHVERYFRGKKSFICYLSDETGLLALRFFHIYPCQLKKIQIDSRWQCFGEIRWGRNQEGALEMVHPQCVCRDNTQSSLLEKTLTPVYPTTEGLSQFVLRKIISQALQYLEKTEIPELLPQEILESMHWPSLKQAILFLHRPPEQKQALELILSGKHPFQQRLAFEELLAHYLGLKWLRKETEKTSAIPLTLKTDLMNSFIKQLPFSLTEAQKRVITQIQHDLMQEHPMMRLVQGDVGSGKTVVASCAILQAWSNGCQVALMAPTELLVEQHRQKLTHWFSSLGIEVAVLTQSVRGNARKQLLERIASGQVSVVIGTHALFQEGVEFHRLALVIIDEQHRFGVNQRLLLRKKGLIENQSPHQLVMTATPIPRTLAMAAYADLDHSIIDEMPLGRLPIHTMMINQERRFEVIHRIRNFCSEKKQVYWVCTLIEESEVLQSQAAENTVEQLRKTLPEFRIALVHGRMKSQEKIEVMNAFAQAQYDILVATTVIEVGLDVANATLMVIENAERLGLAQLHQLRGRVGRGALQSYCILLYQSPLSTLAKDRIQAIRDSQDGFAIAQKDLELRGPGEVLGLRQTGLLNLRVADWHRDQYLLPKVYAIGDQILKNYPNYIPALMDRWLNSVEETTDLGHTG